MSGKETVDPHASGPVESMPLPWFEKAKRASAEESLGAPLTQCLIL